jgi:hypothetical protein
MVNKVFEINIDNQTHELNIQVALDSSLSFNDLNNGDCISSYEDPNLTALSSIISILKAKDEFLDKKKLFEELLG